MKASVKIGIIAIVAVVAFAVVIQYEMSLVSDHDDVTLYYEMRVADRIDLENDHHASPKDGEIFVVVEYKITNNEPKSLNVPSLDWFSFECKNLVYDPIPGTTLHKDYNNTVKQIGVGGTFESVVVFSVPKITGDDLHDCYFLFDGEYDPIHDGYYWH